MPTSPTVPPPTPSRRLLNVAEAAAVLGVAPRTMYRLADNGKIPFGVKVGALRRWDAAELDRFIADGCKPPTPKTKRS